MEPDMIAIPMKILKNGSPVEIIYEVRETPCDDKDCCDGIRGCYNHKCLDHMVNKKERSKWTRKGLGVYN